MASISQLIDGTDDLKSSIIEGLTDSLPDIEEKVVKQILKVFNEFDREKGYFVNNAASKNQILRLQKDIENILEKAGYFDKANTYVKRLSEITENTIQLQKGFSGETISKASMSGIEKQFVQDAINSLSEGGLNEGFIRPIAKAMNEAITLGYSVQSTRDSLESSLLGLDNTDKIAGVRTLKSYLTTTARDTVSQLQGTQQRAIQQQFNMPFIRYVGGIKNDSRGQCVRWKKMQYLEVAELEAEIDLAFDRQKAKATEGKGHVYSGMIAGTNKENFIVRRGGWGCLDTAVPTLKRY